MLASKNGMSEGCCSPLTTGKIGKIATSLRKQLQFVAAYDDYRKATSEGDLAGRRACVGITPLDSASGSLAGRVSALEIPNDRGYPQPPCAATDLSAANQIASIGYDAFAVYRYPPAEDPLF